MRGFNGFCRLEQNAARRAPARAGHDGGGRGQSQRAGAGNDQHRDADGQGKGRAEVYAMKIPRPFIISFSVAMRFFPTAKEEIRNVRDAMTLRGTNFSLYNLRKRPGIIFEGFIVPLLVRSSTVADELSAASITRGLDNPMLRTAFIKRREIGRASCRERV